MKPKEFKVNIIAYCPCIKGITVDVERPEGMDDDTWNEFLESIQDIESLVNTVKALGGVIHEP